ncbi:MAG TPA: hypothetical protein VJ994_11540, partial [Paracoccaceae bacterium]|nr:hypothetical protein [Paracoccaceae bacterium]
EIRVEGLLMNAGSLFAAVTEAEHYVVRLTGPGAEPTDAACEGEAAVARAETVGGPADGVLALAPESAAATSHRIAGAPLDQGRYAVCARFESHDVKGRRYEATHLRHVFTLDDGAVGGGRVDETALPLASHLYLLEL